VDALVEVYKNIQRLSYRGMWWQQKLDELKNLIINCSGIFAEATTRDEFILPGDTASVSCVVNKRNNVDATLVSVNLDWHLWWYKKFAQALKTNQNHTYEIKKEIFEPQIGNATQPYWLQAPQTPGNFIINNPLLVGKAWNDALLNVVFEIEIKGIHFLFAGLFNINILIP
jgi:hypothetical protein